MGNAHSNSNLQDTVPPVQMASPQDIEDRIQVAKARIRLFAPDLVIPEAEPSDRTLLMASIEAIAAIADSRPFPDDEEFVGGWPAPIPPSATPAGADPHGPGDDPTYGPGASSKSARVFDFDGKPMYTLDTRNALVSVRNTTVFRRMCVPARLVDYLGAELLTWDTAHILSTIVSHAHSFDLCTSVSQLSPDQQQWASVSRYSSLKGLPVFYLPQLFRMFCAFQFGIADKGVTLSLRSFLPVEMKTSEWQIERALLALINLQSVCAIVFGPPYADVLEPALAAIRSGFSFIDHSKPAAFLVHSCEVQLYRLGLTLATRWSPANAIYYGVPNLSSLADVAVIFRRTLSEADLSWEAMIKWQIVNANTDKTSSPQAPRSPALKRPQNDKKEPFRKDKKPKTDRNADEKKEQPKKQRAPKGGLLRSGDTPPDNTSTKLCFNNLCAQLGVLGHGRVECNTSDCKFLHILDKSRKHEYVRCVASPAFKVNTAVRALCVTAAAAL